MAATGSEFVKLQQLKTAMDSKQPDMTGVVKAEGESEKTLKVDGETVDAISLLQGITIGHSSTFSIRDIGNQLQALAFSTGDGGIGNVAITCEPGSAGIQIGTIAERVSFGFYQNGPVFSLSRDKSVNSITDAISAAPDGNALVTDKAVADYVAAVSGQGVQFVELFHGNSATVTLPQSFDTYKVLFVVARSNNGYGSGVCVPPDNKARFYDGKYNVSVSFNENTAMAPYAYGVTDIYAIA